MVLITYFDDVKYEQGRQPYQWLAGITVDAGIVRDLVRQVDGLVYALLTAGTFGWLRPGG